MKMEFQRVPSLALLNELLNTAVGKSVLIHSPFGSASTYYSGACDVQGTTITIGVTVSTGGPSPAARSLHDSNLLVVAHETLLSLVSLQRFTVETTVPLGGLFFEFISADDNRLVVLHELGVVCMDSEGEVIWSVDTDVVEDFKFDLDGKLILSIMDEDLEICVDLSTGLCVSAAMAPRSD